MLVTCRWIERRVEIPSPYIGGINTTFGGIKHDIGRNHTSVGGMRTTLPRSVTKERSRLSREDRRARKLGRVIGDSRDLVCHDSVTALVDEGMTAHAGSVPRGVECMEHDFAGIFERFPSSQTGTGQPRHSLECFNEVAPRIEVEQ